MTKTAWTDRSLNPQTAWTLEMGIKLCTEIQKWSPLYHCHPALTGGLLYKIGLRKDCDIVIYQRGDTNGVRHPINWTGLWDCLAQHVGLSMLHDYGYVKKCEWLGKVVDIFDPTKESDYPIVVIDAFT